MRHLNRNLLFPLVLGLVLSLLVLVPPSAGAAEGSEGEHCLTWTADGGPSAPAAAVQDAIDAFYPGEPTRDFDEAGPDKYFAHTFADVVPDGWTLVGGSLEATIETGGNNDAIHVGDFVTGATQPDQRWGQLLTTAGFPSGTPTTVLYDLAALPTPLPQSSATNLLPIISSTRAVDVIVQDDSTVDTLVLRLCFAATCEEFVANSGPMAPRDEVAAVIAETYTGDPTRDFGETGNDKYFAHTFTGIVPTDHKIVSATLMVDVTNGGANDAIHLGQFLGGYSDRWGSSLADAGFPLGVDTTQTFDLRDLPVNGVLTTDLVPTMNQFGFFDVIVQDDSTVRSLTLTVCSVEACVTYTADTGATAARSPLQDFVEATYPGEPTRDFDEAGDDKYFSHSFNSLVPDAMVIDQLGINIRATNNGGNDAVHLGDLFAGKDRRWGAALASPEAGFPLTVPTTGVFDLSALPASGTFATNLVPTTNQTGYVDVVIQDDSTVDRLQLTVCRSPLPLTCQGRAVTVYASRGQQPTARGDVIVGTYGNDVLSGLDGNDVICGLGGKDRIAGGNGRDRIDAGPGRDTVGGGPDRDWLYGGPGPDRINGGSGRDTCIGGPGADTLRSC